MRPVSYMAAVIMVFFTATAWAASDKAFTVTSTSLQIQEKTGDISFEGKVEVRTAEIVLHCDLLVVQTDKADPSKILSGMASGNVVLIRGNDRVKAEEAVFDLEAGKVELTGVPQLIREETTIEAEKIVYSIEEGTASFQGPVKALFKAVGD